MPSERDAHAAWIADVLRVGLPIHAPPYTLALASTAFARDAVTATLLLSSPRRPEDRPSPEPPPPHARELAIVPAAYVTQRARVEAMLRAWCNVLRVVLGDLAAAALPSPPWFGPLDVGNPVVFAAMLHDTSLVTEADFTAAFSSRKHLGRFFAIPMPIAEAALERIYATLTDAPPLLATPLVSLRTLTTPWNDDPPPSPYRGGARVRYTGVVAAFELAIAYQGQTRDIKQEEIEVAPAEALDDLPRVEQYLLGWRDALPAHASLLTLDDLELSVPHDFANPSVLALKRCHTRDDFRRAFEKKWQVEERRKSLAARTTKR